MRRIKMIGKLTGCVVFAILFTMNLSWAQQVPDYIQSAVADPVRPDSDTQRDPDRKPGEVLTFAGVKPGDKVGELMPGRGYFTKLFCKIVGDTGHVYAVNVSPAQPRAPRPASAEEQAPQPGVPCSNITESAHLAAEFELPSGLDLIWTSENYHDLYNEMMGSPDMVKFNKVVYGALKPGGIYMVEDHQAPPRSGSSATDTIHRIDPQQVIKDVTAAGFEFVASSAVLYNPDDPLNVRSSEVEKGVSSKFLLKFRRPF